MMTMFAFTSVAVGVVAALLVAFMVWRDALRRRLRLTGRPDGLIAEADLDRMLDQSFPASDPPSTTTGIARLYPATAPR